MVLGTLSQVEKNFFYSLHKYYAQQRITLIAACWVTELLLLQNNQTHN